MSAENQTFKSMIYDLIPFSNTETKETRIFLTDNETFFPRPISLIKVKRLLSHTKFSDTVTNTFLTKPDFLIPLPRLLKDES